MVQKSSSFFCNPAQVLKNEVSIDGFQQKWYNLKECFPYFFTEWKTRLQNVKNGPVKLY